MVVVSGVYCVVCTVWCVCREDNLEQSGAPGLSVADESNFASSETDRTET